MNNRSSMREENSEKTGCIKVPEIRCEIPRIRPLSYGEVLGCTSPKIKESKICIFIGDGRFHLESVMINNPKIEGFYKYCPFSKKMSRERYGYEKMLKVRTEEKRRAMMGRSFGVILGTLGRQGNGGIFEAVWSYLKEKGYLLYPIKIREINQEILNSFPFIDSFVQISCTRLSLDWGSSYPKPLLNPYEVFNDLEEYSMDYYSNERAVPWSNYGVERKD
ncbi:2-(3-amino-3-carboxypropyl)histidine synthase subunit 1-like [Nylanderia fulva]|uniref:2-(3-amino-3-carboxypropyl)histidine synthase subunit 1-like n=1 Tax=Nylanderia fulva TaxID=613905 RepID=UPI0010FB6783|nr:2-(3-amino-3-carboxypropyl)histidine synthase subunit 1-like [Nylanderia fulva]